MNKNRKENDVWGYSNSVHLISENLGYVAGRTLPGKPFPDALSFVWKNGVYSGPGAILPHLLTQVGGSFGQDSRLPTISAEAAMEHWDTFANLVELTFGIRVTASGPASEPYDPRADY